MTLDYNQSAGGSAYLNNAVHEQQRHEQHLQHQNQPHQQPQHFQQHIPPQPQHQQQQQQHQIPDQHHYLNQQAINPAQHQPDQSFPYIPVASNQHLQTLPSNALTMASTRGWAVGLNMASTSHQQASAGSSPRDDNQANSPISHTSSPNSQHSSLQHSPLQHSPYQAPNPLTDWALERQQAQQAALAQQAAQQRQQQSHHQPPPFTAAEISQFMQDPTFMGFNAFPADFSPEALEYIPPTTHIPQTTQIPATTQAALHASLLQAGFTTMPSLEDQPAAMQWGGIGMESWHDLQNTLHVDGLTGLDSVGSNSPSGSYLEVVSVPGSAGDGWAVIGQLDQFQQPAPTTAIFNPGQTLHLRTSSDSSDGAGSTEFGSFEDIAPFSYSPFSPGSDSNGSDAHSHRHCYAAESHHHTHANITPPSNPLPMPIKTEPVSSRHSPGSGAGSTSPSSAMVPRRNSGPRKSPISKTTTKSTIRRSPNGKKDGAVEKKVGRRKGPLLPEQRKQASEIRKLRACLRCKFLKKTCDKGEPCTGCQPSHARLWQVPCTRIDIKDIAYFMKDWKADYERHMDRGFSVFNVKSFAANETLMWITHGYGFALPVMVRQVYVIDDSCFKVDWVESFQPEQEPIDFETRTERLDVGSEGINLSALTEYLDKHIDGPFEDFIDDHFEGTLFVTEILKTAHRFYVKEKLPVIRKALKLVLAYNLTMHITMIENQGSEVDLDGAIDDEESKFYGRVVAPVMVNFQIKCALADMWRELQKEILEELSSLYSGVYSGEKMKNWPTIFMIAAILLVVWEEMQFDCHYRVPDPAAVDKFCNDMESTPVGVIVGLFHAISQKLPTFADWDTAKHGSVLHNNKAVCEAMTEVRQHVEKHGTFSSTPSLPSHH
jgi:hypothetical protein